MGVELPDFLLQLIAENITANVRQIEGTVNKIMAYQQLMGDSVDKETVVRAVKDMFKEKSDIVPTADVIIDEVCKFYNIEPATLRGQGRAKDISLARQIAMYQIRRMTISPSRRSVRNLRAGTTPPSCTPSTGWKNS